MAGVPCHGEEGEVVIGPLLEILLCDSSGADGVQSRGAGWHARTLSQTQERGAVGDLKRGPGSTVWLLVYDGEKWETLAPLSTSPRDHWDEASEIVARRARGDSWRFWEETNSVLGLLWWATRVGGLEERRVVAAACDCLEVFLRPEHPRWNVLSRSLRILRLWTKGLVTRSAAREACKDARPAYPSADALSIAVSEVLSGPAAAISASMTERWSRAAVARSLAFLVRARIPGWRVGLAVVGRP